MASKRRSIICEFFSLCEDSKFAQCESCGETVDRGGKSTKSYTPTNLVNHLKKHHKEEFEKYAKKKEENIEKQKSMKNDTQPTLKQLTLKQSADRVRIWDINDSRAQLVHRRVMEMIAVDTQSILIVEDVGFTRLLNTLESRYKLPSRQYMTSKTLPEIHEKVLNSIQNVLSTGHFYSFTTDVWSTDKCVASLLSFTTHWLTESFQQKSAVLNVLPLEESHTGLYLASKYAEMLSKWEIPLERVHLVLRDNASSMEKAMRDASQRHSLRSVVSHIHSS